MPELEEQGVPEGLVEAALAALAAPEELAAPGELAELSSRSLGLLRCSHAD